MENYIALFIGMIIYATLQWNETSKSKNFSWLRNIVIPSWLTIVCGVGLIWSKEDLINLYPITKLSSLLLGVSGQAIFKKIVGVADKKTDTVVGIS